MESSWKLELTKENLDLVVIFIIFLISLVNQILEVISEFSLHLPDSRWYYMS
jgi:hypothetical protein